MEEQGLYKQLQWDIRPAYVSLNCFVVVPELFKESLSISSHSNFFLVSKIPLQRIKFTSTWLKVDLIQ